MVDEVFKQLKQKCSIEAVAISSQSSHSSIFLIQLFKAFLKFVCFVLIF